jgi:hypothetical protein
LENIDNCPDISDQYQEAEDTAVSEVHHFCCLSVQWEPPISASNLQHAIAFG